jgi:hypothetical protein
MSTTKNVSMGFKAKDETIQVRPTIYIGLGGSGMEVLSRLRKLHFFRFGKVGLPCMRYLWLDTDDTAMLDGRKDAKIKDLLFRDEEFIDLSVPDEDFKDIISNPHKNAHIHDWLDPAVKALPEIMKGAAQNRQAGRLSFFAHYETIKDAVNSLRSSLMNAGMAEEMTKAVEDGGAGFENYDESKLEIVIVNSLAGGTGAGTAIDFGFFLRDQDDSWKHSTVVKAYSFLASHFFSPSTEQGRVTHANNMAYLMELEYYGTRRDMVDLKNVGVDLTSKHDFRVQWSRNEDAKVVIGPPFDFCYLIDNQSTGGASPLPLMSKEPYEMLAQYLFMKFTGSGFASKLHSAGDNMKGYLLDDVIMKYSDGNRDFHDDKFAQRYCGLGLSHVYVPSDEIRRSCAARMSLDLLDHWLRKSDTSEGVVVQKQQLRQEFGLDYKSLLTRFFKANDGTDWREWLHGEINAGTSNLQQQLQSGDVQSLDRTVNKHFSCLRSHFEKKSNQPTSDWGQVAASMILDIPLQVIEETREAISKTYRSWAQRSHRGLDYCITSFSALAGLLPSEIERHADRKAEVERKLGRSKARLQKLVSYIRDEQSSSITQTCSLKALINETLGLMKLYFDMQLEKLALDQIIDHHHQLQVYLGSVISTDPNTGEKQGGCGLLLTCQKLEKDLQWLRLRLQDDLRAAESAGVQITAYRVSEPEAYKHYYKLRAPGSTKTLDIGFNEIEKLEADVLNELNYQKDGRKVQVGDVSQLSDYVNAVGASDLKATIERHALSWFSETKNQMKLDLLDHLGHWDAERISGVRQVLKWAEPWSGMRYGSMTTQKLMLIGMHEDHTNNERLRALIDDVVAGSKPPPVTTSTLDAPKDAIWVATEVHGLPAFAVPNIDVYEKAYQESLGTTERHSTCRTHIFNPIIPMGDKAASDHLNVVNILTTGILFGILDAEKNAAEKDHKVPCVFGYLDETQAPARYVNLDYWKRAIKFLKSSNDNLRFIEDENVKLRRLLDDDARKRLLRAIVLTLDAGKRFGIRKINSTSNPNGEDVVSAEYTVIRDLQSKLMDDLGWSVRDDFIPYWNALSDGQRKEGLRCLEDDEMTLYIPEA